jgi:predicted ATPase/class 3 adenylate cyclase
VGPPSGTVTFLFTDIEGSTRLWDAVPDAMRAALGHHDDIVRSVIEGHDGYVFATGGDGFAAAFARAADALAAAIAAQRSLGSAPWPDEAPLQVRIGIHTGEAWERDDDYFGPAVNTAARLMSAAGPGQVLCTHVTAAVIGAQPGCELVDLGDHELRGLSARVRVFGVAADGLATPAIVSAGLAGNLPKPVTEFVGRRGQVQQLRSLVGPRRCLTLTGTGGVGKTRLAVELAWSVASDHEDGAWFVDLASITDPALVPVAAAHALGVRIDEGRSPLDAIADALRRRDLLVVIDNCEHLLDACCDVVERVRAECAGVALVATSREPLGIAGEQVWRVASLDPSGDAVELFLDRVSLADAAFSPTADDVELVRQACARLDGIPLAIELAAARLPSLGAAGLVARLDDRFSLLRGGRRGGRRGSLERHQTLRAAVAWSYQLLLPAEAAVFDRCAVFADGFDVGAAVAVCGEGMDELEVLDHLSALADKSMLVSDPDERGPRYRALETLRQFAEEQLIEDDELATACDRHLHHFLGLAELAGAAYETAAQRQGARDLGTEWGNLRAALNWALAQGEVDAAARLVEASAMFAVNSLRYEHQDWARAVLGTPGTSSRTVMGIAAYWLVLRGEFEAAVELASSALEDAADDLEARMWCLLAWHMACYSLGELDDATRAADELASATADQPPYRRLIAAVMRAQAALGHGDAASPAYEDVLRLAAEVDNAAARSFALGHRGMEAHSRGDVATAIDLLGQAVDEAKHGGLLVLQGGWMTGIAFVVSGITTNDRGSGEAFGRVLRHAADTRDGLSALTGLEALSIHLAATGRLPEAALILGHLEHNNRRTADMAAFRAGADSAVGGYADAAACKARGASMSRDAVVAYALGVLGHDAQMVTRASDAP